MSQLNINTLATQSGSVIYLSSHVSGSSTSTGSFGRVETGNLTVGGSQGSDGEVLTSTGTGVAWEAAGGGVDGIVSTADATAITINSSEIVGIGVTPETWEGFELGGNFYGARALQIGDLGGLWYNIDFISQEASFHLSENVYCNNMGPTYIDVAPATDYEQKAGVHRFRVAGMNPTPGELIYWTTALEIKNDGRGLSQFTAKAWAYFDGTGTPSFHDSHNCSTITDGGTGTYSINYTNNLGSADYAAVGSVGYCQHGPLGTDMKMVVTNRAERSEDQGGDSTAALCRMIVATGRNGGPADDDNISLVVFGD